MSKEETQSWRAEGRRTNVSDPAITALSSGAPTTCRHSANCLPLRTAPLSGRGVDSGARLLGFKNQIYHPLGTLGKLLMSPCLCFFICKMPMKTAPTSQDRVRSQ